MLGKALRTTSFLVAALLVAGAAPPTAAADATTSAREAAQREAIVRFEHAQAIVRNVARDAQQAGLSDGWETSTLTSLLARPSSELASLATTTSYRTLFDRTARPSAKALGDPSTDLVFRPVTPCRIIDTRFVGGKIGPTRSYNVDALPCGLSGFADGVIAALVVNITVLDTSTGAPGFLTIRPEGASGTTALVNWFVGSATAQISNAAIVPIDQGAAVNDMEIVTSNPVHVIVDLFGMFLAPGATALECATVGNPSGATTTGDVAPGQSAIFGAACAAGYTVTGGGCHYFTTAQTAPAATDNKVLINRSFRPFDPMSQTFLNSWTCHFTNTDPMITWRVQTRAVCCRVPGR